MAFGVSTRTLFLVVRGVYMGRPLNDLRKDLGDLDKDEKRLIRQQEQMKNTAYQQAYAQIFQGVAFVAFASMALYAFTKVIEKSKEGKVFMEQFGKSIDSSLSRFGTAFLKILGPFLSGMANLLDIISGFPPALYALSGLLIVGTMLLFAYGATKLLSGAWAMLTLKQMTYASTLPALNVQLAGTTTSMNLLAAATMRAFAIFFLVFTIVNMIATQFGVLPAIIAAVIGCLIPLVIILWQGATAMSVLTLGIAAIAGIAGIVAAVAATPTPAYKTGTTMVRHTGYAMVHAGEIVKSTRESPDQGLIQTGGRGTTQNVMTVNIGHVHTKAEFDDFKRLMRKELAEIMKGSD